MTMNDTSFQAAAVAAIEPPVMHTDTPSSTKVRAEKVNVFYGAKQALFDVSLDIPERSVTALIGPSGCGKSTFIRCLDRMNDVIEGCRGTGPLTLDGENIYSSQVDPAQ